MINVENSNLEYEQINQKIKKIQSFKESEKSFHFIPLSNYEIKKDIIEEFNPIINSLKKEIILNIKDIQNELKFYKLKSDKTRSIKTNILELNNLINKLNNKVNILNDENKMSYHLLNNNKKEKAKRNIQLISKKNLFLNNYEEN